MLSKSVNFTKYYYHISISYLGNVSTLSLLVSLKVLMCSCTSDYISFLSRTDFLQFGTFGFRRSRSTCSLHLTFGLPFSSSKGFHSVIFLTVVFILRMCPYHHYLCDFTIRAIFSSFSMISIYVVH